MVPVSILPGAMMLDSTDACIGGMKCSSGAVGAIEKKHNKCAHVLHDKVHVCAYHVCCMRYLPGVVAAPPSARA
jgi:hypothetical protein